MRLNRWQNLAGDSAQTPYLVYGGNQAQKRSGINVLPWPAIDELESLG